jgi:hypothetical protein
MMKVLCSMIFILTLQAGCTATIQRATFTDTGNKNILGLSEVPPADRQAVRSGW